MALLFLILACGLLSRPTPTLPHTDLRPLPIDYEVGAADLFLGVEKTPPEGAARAIAWWHGPDGEKPPGATDRVGPPIGVATLLREGYAVWNILEIDTREIRMGRDVRPIALSEGRIPEDELRGMLVDRLYDVQLERMEGNKDLEAMADVDLPDWRLGLRAAPDVPWSTMLQVVWTAGQAQFGTQCFLGEGTYEALPQRCFSLPRLYPPGVTPPPVQRVVVRRDGAWLVGADGEAPLDPSRLTDAIVQLNADPDLPTGAVAGWIGRLGRAGVKEVLVGSMDR